mgnify:CR=1 FL=1
MRVKRVLKTVGVLKLNNPTEELINCFVFISFPSGKFFMASEKSLNLKKATVNEIKDKLKNNKTFLILNYQGLSVPEVAELRRKLREVNTDFKVYKNTLMNIALTDEDIKLNDYMEGPNAYLFSSDIIEPIKVVSEFAKAHPALEVRVGLIDNEIADKNLIDTYATIPSMEGLLTMLAGGMMEHVRNLSIALNLYGEGLEK